VIAAAGSRGLKYIWNSPQKAIITGIVTTTPCLTIGWQRDLGDRSGGGANVHSVAGFDGRRSTGVHGRGGFLAAMPDQRLTLRPKHP